MELQEQILQLLQNNNIKLNNLYAIVGKMMAIEIAIVPLLKANNITLDELKSECRESVLTRKKHKVWIALYKLGFSYPIIGRFCGKDPSAIWYANNCKKKLR